MGRILMPEVNEIETIGSIVRKRQFQCLSCLTIISVTLLLIMSVGGHWPSTCSHPDIALYGLIGGIYTMAVGTTSLIISWLLVDDCTWFFKSSLMFVSSFLFIVCGMYYFYGYFHDTVCNVGETEGNISLSSDITHLQNKTVRLIKVLSDPNGFDNQEYSCQEWSVKQDTPWIPVLITFCILLGVLYFLFALYLLLTLDLE